MMNMLAPGFERGQPTFLFASVEARAQSKLETAAIVRNPLLASQNPRHSAQVNELCPGQRGDGEGYEPVVINGQKSSDPSGRPFRRGECQLLWCGHQWPGIQCF
eukprot:scaffold152823_cov14-Tisochrysis_lutea.AAC.1